MKIAVQCKGCASRYAVDARHAGGRLKCKKCGEAIRVPAPPAPAPSAAPAEDDPDIFPLADLAHSSGTAAEEEQSRAIAAAPPRAARRPRAAAGNAEVSPPPPQSQQQPRASRVDWAARLHQSLDLVRRYAPRRWRVWAVGAVVLLLGVGLVSVNMARMAFYTFITTGLLLFLVAALWGGAVALLNGGRAVKGMVIASPLLLLPIFFGQLARRGGDLQAQVSASGMGIGQLSLMVACALVVLLMVIGFFANMRAMRGPLATFGCGVGLLVLSVLPLLVHGARARSNRGGVSSLHSPASRFAPAAPQFAAVAAASTTRGTWSAPARRVGVAADAPAATSPGVGCA